VDAPEWLRGLGLDAYEYQCGRGVGIGEKSAKTLGGRAGEHGIVLSLHAPYYINLANPDPESLKKAEGYVLEACRAADWMGAGRVIVHSGTLMKRTRRQAMEIARKSLQEVRRVCDGEGYGHIALCPETMGKIGQLGDLDEVLELCTLDERHIPCIDFGHLYARSFGQLQGRRLLPPFWTAWNRNGKKKGLDFHSHFSKIEIHPNGGKRCTSPSIRTGRPGFCSPGMRDRPPWMAPRHHLRIGRHTGGGRSGDEADVS
jgi:deoxyribonuclease-4